MLPLRLFVPLLVLLSPFFQSRFRQRRPIEQRVLARLLLPPCFSPLTSFLSSRRFIHHLVSSLSSISIRILSFLISLSGAPPSRVVSSSLSFGLRFSLSMTSWCHVWQTGRHNSRSLPPKYLMRHAIFTIGSRLANPGAESLTAQRSSSPSVLTNIARLVSRASSRLSNL